MELEQAKLQAEEGSDPTTLETLERSEFTLNDRVPFSHDTQEDWSWLDDIPDKELSTGFVYVNEDRRTVQAGE